MSLYINNQHSNVYKNKNQIGTNNQTYIRHNVLKDLLDEQKKANQELSHTLTQLQSQYKKQQKAQKARWNYIHHQLNESQQHQAKKDTEISQQLGNLNKKSADLQQTILQGTVKTESILEQIHHIQESNREISQRLEKTEGESKRISRKLEEQQELQKGVIEKLGGQEEFQSDVLKRLDSQEALTEKILRQINHIRSILFERTNYLATKIEDGYQLTSTYVYQLMTGTDQPLTFSMLKNKEKQKK
ncbi:hypothetical protein [Niallia sp. Krafla_26]|uniref:hypothetical protein n=1 Tax=Niallia sp. Krafla_26 TaxID=3064703 RepID=UPI003D17F9DF